VDFFAVGDEAKGFIAIGQVATGFIAIGQAATGFIAIGQLARGVFTLGQLGFGFIGWGQAGVGLWHAVGMLGIGGRGFGGVLPLVPGIGRPRVTPTAMTLTQVQAGGEPGWVALDVYLEPTDGSLALVAGGARLPMKIHRAILKATQRLVQTKGTAEQAGRMLSVFAWVVRYDDVLVCERIMHVPPRPYEEPGFKVRASFQLTGLVGLGVAWWLIVGNDLLPFLVTLFSEL
jgi:hypothetical protein